ncbi:MAG: hypothetical protein DME38_13540 [Verrucomicrobia bacterium]|nr:MAG: hypothetical protein DME38_13540 [Verrucomicrobiota bacterium]
MDEKVGTDPNYVTNQRCRALAVSILGCAVLRARQAIAIRLARDCYICVTDERDEPAWLTSAEK